MNSAQPAARPVDSVESAGPADSDDSALWDSLDDLFTRGSTAMTAETNCSWGPIPLTLRADSSSELADIERHLAPGPARWAPLTVTTVTSDTIPIEEIPEPLRPVGETSAIARSDDRLAIASGPEHSLWILRRDLGTAFRWVTHHHDLPLWERISPLRAAGRWWAAAHGAATVHSGIVGNERGAVVLVGDAGAGKSTTTMACHGTGLTVLGDDFSFLDAPTEDGPAHAHAMYRLAKLDDNSLGLLPHLTGQVVGTGLRGKSLIELDSPSTPTMPVVGVCHVVQARDRPTGLAPMSRAAALRAVAPSTIFQVRISEQETWSVLAATIKSVPCFHLYVNRLDDVEAVLTELIETS